MFDVCWKNKDQLVYYDPGVGTMGARAAITPWGKALTRVAGMAIGYGIKDDIQEAYTWLMRQYRRGDRIYVFGFSRGAYTARALTGMLRTVGLLHANAENLVPYALKLYAKSGMTVDPGRLPDDKSKQAEKEFWKLRSDFRERFGNADFPNPFDSDLPQVHFLGVWDTVKSVGWLNVKARLEVAHWPFTRNLANVGTARHALAIDERRRPFTEYRFKGDALASSNGRLREVWFAGVHSDVGGQSRPDNQLPDIAFAWMVNEAVGSGLLVEERRYRQLLGVSVGDELPGDRALGVIKPNAGIWRLALGWRARPVRDDDEIHPSVQYRIENSERLAVPYRPKNLPGSDATAR